MNIRKSALRSGTSLAALTILVTPAFAVLDEITVTAQKREQNLQDVPIAITAFDTAQLEANRIEGLEDIGQFATGLYVTPNPADNNGVRIYIRGIGTLDPQIGQDSRVAIYQDGVYLGKTQGLAFDLPDMERVEILKGPQGTLYGRNTTAGAVNLISARPDPSELKGKIGAEYGNFDHKKLTGAINVPLGEDAAIRLSGVYLDREGWVENDGPGTDFGGETKLGLRAAVGFEVTPDFRFDLTTDYTKVEKEPLFYQSLIDSPGVGFFGPAIMASGGRQEDVTTSFAPEEGDLETKGISGIATWNINENNELKVTAAYREMDSQRFVTLIPTADPAIVNQITDGFNQALVPLPFSFGISSIIDGVTLRPDWGDQFPGDPNTGIFISGPGGSTTIEGHEQFSFEATLNGQTDNGKLEYTLGGFYFDEKTGSGLTDQPSLTDANSYLFVLSAFSPQLTPASTSAFLSQFGIEGLGPIPASLTLLQFLSPMITPTVIQAFGELGNVNAVNAAVLGGARQSAANDLTIDTQAFAFYGQLTYHVTDDFRITAGLRYSEESKDGIGQTASPFFLDNIDLLGNLIPPNISSYEDDILDPALTLEYDINDDMMVYASYKEGYRAGGFNAAAVGTRLPGKTYSPDFNFGREDLTAYEIGFKGDFADRVRINAAGFYYDFSNKQTTLSLNPIIATERAVVNTDDEVYGFEFDGQFEITDALTARGSYTYIDGEAGDTVNPNDPTDTRDFDELQGTPKNSWLVALDYNDTWGDMNVFGNVSYSHKDSTLSIPESNLRLPAYDLLNGRIGVSFETGNGHQATIALWGTNLLDEEYLIDSLPFETFAYRTGVFGQPRSFGITAGYKF